MSWLMNRASYLEHKTRQEQQNYYANQGWKQ